VNDKAQLLVFEDGHIILAMDRPIPDSVKEKVRDTVREWREAPGQDYPMLCMTDVNIEIVKGLPKVSII
jgi:hypothetical protein